jgi:hypothetical protein
MTSRPHCAWVRPVVSLRSVAHTVRICSRNESVPSIAYIEVWPDTDPA